MIENDLLPAFGVLGDFRGRRQCRDGEYAVQEHLIGAAWRRRLVRGLLHQRDSLRTATSGVAVGYYPFLTGSRARSLPSYLKVPWKYLG